LSQIEFVIYTRPRSKEDGADKEEMAPPVAAQDNPNEETNVWSKTSRPGAERYSSKT